MDGQPVSTPNVRPSLIPPDLEGSGRYVENTEYAGFVQRIIRAHGRRVAEGNIDGLADLAALRAEVERALHTAVTGLRAGGYSWAEIGRQLGMAKQSAYERWGSP